MTTAFSAEIARAPSATAATSSVSHEQQLQHMLLKCLVWVQLLSLSHEKRAALYLEGEG